ncbi:hypothetical protein J7363_04695 [Phaeobacter italicus]|uniref:hypothetical protein n=1 Tax=Phaeobacter italicus TaxID=481446 RepID=UPI001ADA0717|nr:hypothetical protein [Phaeobacter italicus]MBO9441379.1 hypothetical protein [Phaeobacter italicus]
MSRTVLEIAKSAANSLGLEPPSDLFDSSNHTAVQLLWAVTEASLKILREHDWRLLFKISTSTGDGNASEFSLPSDFLRMPVGVDVWSSRIQSALSRIDPEEWLQMDVGIGDTSYGAWTLFGGNIVFRPALSQGEVARFWYLSNLVVQEVGGTYRERFASNDDQFRLDDRVLELFLIYEWRKQKGLDYTEEMQDAYSALSKEAESDKGARIISQRSSRNHPLKVAYPGVITP